MNFLSNSESEEEEEENYNDINEISPISNLPPEVLMKILSYVEKGDKFRCRLVSWTWNEISSLLLHDEEKDKKSTNLIVWLRFDYNCNDYMCKPGSGGKQKTLEQFIQCFTPPSSITSSSSNSTSIHLRPFPFSRFYISDIEHFEEEKMLNFLSIFGPFIKSLTLELQMNDWVQLKTLWKLLNQLVPNLQELGIEEGGLGLESRKNNLDNSNNNDNNVLPSFLQNIKRLKLCPEYLNYPKFICHLLENSPKLQEVVPMDSSDDCWDVKDLLFWRNVEKLHLIKKVEIRRFPKEWCFDLKWNDDKFWTGLSLHTLNLACHSDLCKSDMNLINFINRVCDICRDTLKSIRVNIKENNELNEIPPFLYFLRGKILPKVCKVYIDAQCNPQCQETLLDQISQLCPNTTHLKFKNNVINFPKIASIIYTGLKSIKSLILTIDMQSPKNNCLAIDSVLTGYSKESMDRIRRKLKKKIPIDKARRDEPQNLSIFDLTDLSHLEIRFLVLNRLDKHSAKGSTAEEIKNLLILKILPLYLKENPSSLQIYDPHKKEYNSLFPSPRQFNHSVVKK